jgi:hypothetical protein
MSLDLTPLEETMRAAGLTGASLWFWLAGILALGVMLRILLNPSLPPGEVMFTVAGEELGIDEACQNFLITGGIGSGKTNALNYLALNLTSHQPRWGGLWLDNKGNSESDLRAVLRAFNREADAIVLKARTEGAAPPAFFYNVLHDPAFTAEALGFAVMEVTSPSSEAAHGEFFKTQGAMHITKAIQALRLLGKPVTFTGLFSMLTETIKMAEIEKALLTAAQDSAGSSALRAEAQTLHDHFKHRFLAMPPDQFGGVVGTISNALNPFQTPAVAEVFASTRPQSFQFSDLEKGRVLCISLPQIYPQERYALNALFKQLFYQYSLARYDNPRALKSANVLCLWLDEAQHSLRKGDWGDYRWLDRLRAARCAVVMAMQDHTSCYPVLGKDVTVVTLAQLRNRLIFGAPTFESAEISANFIGKRETQKITRGFSGGRSNISRTPHEEHTLKPQEITGLKNHRCHIYLATKVLRRNRRLPRCEPASGIFPGRV